MTSDDPDEDDRFGSAIALGAGTRLVVGCYQADPPNYNAGSVYVFDYRPWSRGVRSFLNVFWREKHFFALKARFWG